MHPGEQLPSTRQSAAGPGGRGTDLLLGGITFAVVFLLIVGATVAYLVFRPGGGSDPGAGPAPVQESASATEAGTGSTSASSTPTDVEPERCWAPDRERTSSNPSGTLRGGGLQFIPPAVYDQRGHPRGVAYANDLQGAQALVEGTWYSTTFVGKVEWQPGVEYPGAEVAAQMITDCLFYANMWGDTQGRSLDEEITEPVTVAGIPGYRTTAVVNFASAPMERTDATELVVVVLETEQGPSVFGADTAIGVTEHEEAVDAAYESLTGLS